LGVDGKIDCPQLEQLVVERMENPLAAELARKCFPLSPRWETLLVKVFLQMIASNGDTIEAV
jgi:hypothetical protein